MSSPDRSGWLIAVVGLAGAVGGAIATSAFSYLNNKADNDAKMIELSVGILRAKPTDETRPLRQWAIANFQFDDAQKAALLQQELPFKGPSFTQQSSGLPLGIP